LNVLNFSVSAPDTLVADDLVVHRLDEVFVVLVLEVVVEGMGDLPFYHSVLYWLGLIR